MFTSRNSSLSTAIMNSSWLMTRLVSLPTSPMLFGRVLTESIYFNFPQLILTSMLTSLCCFKYFWVIFDHFSGHRVPADPRRTNEDEDLPGEGSHLLHGLIELQVRSVHLGVFPEVIWEPLFLLLLKSGKFNY